MTGPHIFSQWFIYFLLMVKLLHSYSHDMIKATFFVKTVPVTELSPLNVGDSHMA